MRRALDRIDAFRAIHEPGGISMEAARCLFEAVGISEEALGLIGERILADEGRWRATRPGGTLDPGQPAAAAAG